MATWDVLLERNRKYSETSHVPEALINEFKDKDIPPFFIDAFIVRNAGGRLKSCITDLIFIDAFTQGQAMKDIVIIHHTGKTLSLNKPLDLTVSLDCGFTHSTDEAMKDSLKENSPHLAGRIDQLYFGTFGSSAKLEESVREDLDFLRSEPLVRQEIKDNAKGYIYDIQTGRLNPVVDKP
ncbi:hypothetical protein DM02DRAFT_635458 [Periconia macrospinosa]|uniref:Uncharacterized protein n=1 Tax=Periconia macrospinosa TaxID=97972 RepID=A0A2V1D2S7_9PLEO|nr:hypothetical protein DM02DRAFT_635458 [Periconia macrospinosa]